jgi:hypothetical protein
MGAASRLRIARRDLYDSRVSRIVILVAALGLVMAPAAGGVVIGFRTPSGNIGCQYATGLGPGAPSSVLRCDIRSRLRPLPPKPPKCDLDWGDSYEMGPTGRPDVTCHGDTAIDPRNPALRYGSTWHHGAFTCVSKPTGLRCRNRSGHGFFLSTQHSYRF